MKALEAAIMFWKRKPKPEAVVDQLIHSWPERSQCGDLLDALERSPEVLRAFASSYREDHRRREWLVNVVREGLSVTIPHISLDVVHQHLQEPVYLFAAGHITTRMQLQMECESALVPLREAVAADQHRERHQQLLSQNLNKLKTSQSLDKWIDAHFLGWSHQDWEDYFAQLKVSEYWPLDLEHLGKMIERAADEKRARALDEALKASDFDKLISLKPVWKRVKPLIAAVNANVTLEVIEFLLRQGADRNECQWRDDSRRDEYYEQSVVQYASERGRDDIAELIKSFGG